MSDQRISSDGEQSKRDIPSFIEPRPPLISNPFMRPKPQKGTNLLELFEDSELEDPDWVQVYLRLKPCSTPSNLYEVKHDRCLITSVDTATAGHGRRTQHNVSKMYTFSHIFGPESCQKEIFEQVVKENLKKLPEGHNFTLLTYGASGSGKTYTLMGTVTSPGLVPRSLEYVFRIVDAAQRPVYKPSEEGAESLKYTDQELELQWVRRLRYSSVPLKDTAHLRDKYRRMSAQLRSDMTSTLDLTNRTRYYVWVSFVEIYNEGIYDLLANSDRSKATSKLRIREDSSGNVYVKGAMQAFVRSGEEAYDVLVAGKHNLQVAATGVHAQSSRSHCIFTITMLTETETGVRTSYVRLCDLAGCERARVTRNTGARMVESRAINTSLHVLERCMHALRRKQRTGVEAIVPYRESKLTRLLGAGLSGAKGEAVSMVVTLNPSPQYVHETKHVLQLAAVARDIQINQTVALTESTFDSVQDSTMDISTELMRLRADNERLHFELIQAQNHIKELNASIAEQQQKTAATMTELVEEAKRFTARYYEDQLALYKQEMEDLKEEYEDRLKDAEALQVRRPEGNTHSRTNEGEVSQLMEEIALLEEKLSAEQLARAKAEDEVQYLRACIDVRDNEKSEAEDEVSSECDEETDADESLEPTFKTKDINRSIQKLKSQNRTEAKMVSLKLIGIKAGNDSTEIEESESIDVNDDNHDNSVLEVSNDDPRRSVAMTDSKHDTKNKTTNSSSNSYHEQTGESTYITGESNMQSNENIDHENDIKEKTHNENNDYDGDLSEDASNIDGEDNAKQSDDNNRSSGRGTYFVRESEFDKSELEKSRDVSQSNSRETYFVEKIENDDVQQDVNMTKSRIDSRCTYFVKDKEVLDNIVKKEIKSEKIEGSADTTDIPKGSETPCYSNQNQSNNYEKQHDRDTRLDKDNEIALKNIAAECDFKEKSSNAVTPEKVVNKLSDWKRQNHANDVSLAQFELLEKASNLTKSPGKKLSDAFSNIRIAKDQPYFDDIVKHGNDISDLIKDKMLHKATNIKNIVNSIETKLDDERSPSIVKDDVASGFEPSTIKKLLGESFTRPDILPIHKVALPTKHHSMDIFEGFDSPGVVKAKVDAEISKIKPKPEEINIESIAKVTNHKESTDKIHTYQGFNDKYDKKISKEDKDKQLLGKTETEIDYSKVVVKQEKIDYDFVRPMRPVSILDTCIEKSIAKERDQCISKETETSNASSSVIESTRKCIAEMVLKQGKELKVNIERTSISKYFKKKDSENTEIESVKDNTIDEFENLAKTVTPRTTEFDLLVAQTIETSEKLNKEIQAKKIKEFEKAKYNLRHKSTFDCKNDEPQQSKTEKKIKRTLRLRRAKQDSTEETSDKETKLKEIVNLQREFSDVTLDMPACKKVTKDIPSPEEGPDENLPPQLGIQSCPSKSVTRSRRKLFTPLAEPLEESLSDAASNDDRVRVPRPSYHRPRARRRL